MADPNAPTEAASTTSTEAGGDAPSPDRFEGSSYAIDREVARGGMGRIVAAEDVEIGRPVAIKELLLRSPGAAARFQREARLTARLQHPGIIPIYEIGAWADGTPYYAMRMVEGKTLREAVAQCDSLASRLRLLPAVIAAAEAVAFAHSKKVIHRDLSPNNVLVGAFGETVVIDWGIAKVIGDHKSDAQQLAEDLDASLTPRPKKRSPTQVDLTVEGSLMGTIAYMPPEQASGEAVDTRADVYTLGALLYYTLSGKPPYEGPDVLEALHAGPPRDLGELVPEVARDLRSIVAKAMARSAGDRYRDAGALVEELRRFEAGAVVHAHRYTRRERLRRWARRRRGVLIGCAAALIGATIATSFLLATGRDEVAAQPTCAEEAPSLAGIWDPALRRGAEESFVASKLVVGKTLVNRIVGALDNYTTDLTRSSIDSCEATRKGTQTTELAAWRDECISDRLEEVRAVVAALQLPSPALATIDVGIFELTRSSLCTEKEARPLPSLDRTKLREIGKQVAHARVAGLTGDRLEYLVQSRRAYDNAKQLGWVEKRAEVALLLGNALIGTGQMPEGEEMLRDALRYGLEARRDDLAAPAAHQTATLLAAAHARFDEARTLLAVGDALVARAGDSRLTMAGLQTAATVHGAAGDPRRALEVAKRALGMSIDLWGASDPMVFSQEFGAGASMTDAGLFRQAIPHLERAIALREPVAGKDDLVTTGPRTLLGMAYTYTGRFEDSERELSHALRLRERTGNAFFLISTLENLADLRLHQGKLDPATAAIDRAQGLARMLGTHHPAWTQVSNTKARVLMAQGKLADARKLLDQLVSDGRDNPVVPKSHALRAEVALAERDWREAEAAGRRAIAGYERTGGAEHPELWRPLAAVGHALLEQGKRDDAAAQIARARRIAAMLEFAEAEYAALTALERRL